MKNIRLLSLLTVSMTASFGATPVVTAVVNNYSYTLPSSPNHGIALGSIFVIFGANLANTTTALQRAPLPTSLSGVQVGLGADGETNRLAYLYYVSPTQIVGVLPSVWPVGTSFLWVRNNNEQSVPVAFKVVRSAFGVLTRDASGFGPAAAFDEQSNPLSSSNASQPGRIISLYGSGVGPVTGGDELIPTQNNLTNIPMTAEIGGMNAEILYRGRTLYPGLDQINLRVPNLGSDAFGCNVRLVIKSSGISSNAVTIPIAQSGAQKETCPVPQTSSNTDTTVGQAEIDRWVAAGSFTRGDVWLSPDSYYTYAGYFYRLSGVRRNDTAPATPSAGQCLANTSFQYADSYVYSSYKDLDAGPFLHVNGPRGTAVAPWGQDHYPEGYSGFYSVAALDSRTAAGRYIFSSPGGPEMGPFSGTLDVGPEFVWSNQEEAKVVTRANGLTVRWSGGDPKELVSIYGFYPYPSPAAFQCFASNSAGEFTVPASILNQVREGAGRISLSTKTSTRMQAPGIDYLTAHFSWSVSTAASFK